MCWCNLCRNPVPVVELLAHLVIQHPDRYDPPATWPDGKPVVIDLCPTQDDFRAWEAQ
jgi:hypothetical protein